MDLSLDTLTLFRAVSDDAAKMAVLTEIEGKLREVQVEREELEKRAAAVNDLAKQAKTDRDAAETARADVAQREKKLESDTANLSSAIRSHTEEKQRFEQVRAQVEKDHAAREDKNAADESRLADLDETLAKRARDLTVREANAAQIEAAVKRRMIAMKAALETP